jgi:hypothetical protein
MNTMKHSLIVTIVSLAACSQAFPVSILFDDQTTFDSNFPSAERSFVGNRSEAALLSSPDRVSITAQRDDLVGSSRAVISTSTSFFSDMDFIDSTKIFTFNNPVMSFTTSGTSYIAYLGVANEVNQIQNAEGALFFQIERSNANATLLSLVQRQSSATTTLETWDIATLFDNTNGQFVFDNLEMTVSATGWSVSGLGIGAGANPNLNITGSGAFSTAFDSTNWGSSTDYYVTLQTRQVANSDDRFTNLQLESVVVVPEPSSVMLGLVGFASAFLLRRRLRNQPIR